MKFKAVIFDLDGTLIDSEPLWQQAEIAVFGSVGVTLTVEDCKKTIGVRLDQVVKFWYDQFPWEGPSLDDVREQILEEMVFQIGQKGEAKPGVHEAINYFTSRGYPLGLASASFQKTIDATLKRLQLTESFAVVHSAQFELKGKPDPAVFLSAAKKLKVDPADCLVFEDSLNGIRAAKAAGMICVAVEEEATPFAEAQALADYSLHSFTELLQAPWLQAA